MIKKILKKLRILVPVVLVHFLFSCDSTSQKGKQEEKRTIAAIDRVVASSPTATIFESEDLIIRKISAHVYEHITFLESNDLERRPCNGIIIVKDNEAIVLDTPTNEQISEKLIKYIKKEFDCKIKAVAATNFRTDALGGLKAFHRNNIPSYGSNKTIALAQKENFSCPVNGFDEHQIIDVGNKKVYLEYFGEGYTKGNIIGYFPEDKLIFGGGMIKEQDAVLGNMNGTNTDMWAKTVIKVRQKYPEAKIVVPGHGEPGGPELLDYTISLFR